MKLKNQDWTRVIVQYLSHLFKPLDIPMKAKKRTICISPHRTSFQTVLWLMFFRRTSRSPQTLLSRNCNKWSEKNSLTAPSWRLPTVHLGMKTTINIWNNIWLIKRSTKWADSNNNSLYRNQIEMARSNPCNQKRLAGDQPVHCPFRFIRVQNVSRKATVTL